MHRYSTWQIQKAERNVQRERHEEDEEYSRKQQKPDGAGKDASCYRERQVEKWTGIVIDRQVAERKRP